MRSRLACALLVAAIGSVSGCGSALASKNNATLKTYASLNHLFIAGAGAPNPAEYELPGHMDASVLDDIVSWVDAARN